MAPRMGSPLDRLRPLTLIFGFLFILLPLVFTIYSSASSSRDQAPRGLLAKTVNRLDVASLQDISVRSLSNHSLVRRDEDFSCDIGRPCHNGACCGVSGFCGYGML